TGARALHRRHPALRSRHPRRRPRLRGGAGERDRKSTRLNSSHGSISYAVFCLKKKKKKNKKNKTKKTTHKNRITQKQVHPQQTVSNGNIEKGHTSHTLSMPHPINNK